MLIKRAAAVAVFIIVFLAAQRLLMPKHAGEAREGALVGSYYAEAPDHDVLFFGDCEVYSNISPVTLWERFGAASFVRGSPQQLVWQSYYLMEESLRRETPAAVVFNVMAMQYGAPRQEEFNRLTLDGMRLSDIKIKAVLASRTEGESLLSYVFPLLRYHDRWSGLGADDFKYFLAPPQVSISGYMLRADIKPVDTIPSPNPRADYRFATTCYEYLDRMAKLCAEKGVTLVLMKAPVLYPYWYPQWDEQIAAYAEANGLLYVNCLDYIEEIGLDFSRDTFNGGLHLNVYGAEKLTVFIGSVLSEHIGLPDRRGDAAASARWAAKSELYHREKARQERELEEYGKIRSLLIE
jgi:hypothetical protein